MTSKVKFQADPEFRQEMVERAVEMRHAERRKAFSEQFLTNGNGAHA